MNSQLGITGRANRFGTLTAMPDDERTADERTAEDDGPVFSGFGVASAALGLLSVATIVLALMIWSGHKSDADERRYQTEVLETAAEWTTVLINMNKDGIDASLQRLHDGTVGELNNDFESALEPYKKVVQTLQSRTKGQVDSVAIESIHHRPWRPWSHPRRGRRRSARTSPASRRRCAGTSVLTYPTSTASC